MLILYIAESLYMQYIYFQVEYLHQNKQTFYKSINHCKLLYSLFLPLLDSAVINLISKNVFYHLCPDFFTYELYILSLFLFFNFTLLMSLNHSLLSLLNNFVHVLSTLIQVVYSSFSKWQSNHRNHFKC